MNNVENSDATPPNNLVITFLAFLVWLQQLVRTRELEDAISSYRQELALYPLGHPVRADILSDLAVSLYSCFEELGRADCLEDAISSHREALTLRPPGHSDRSASLTNLANALCVRFERLGRTEDLDDAISSHYEALTLHPPGHQYRSTSLDNLGLTLNLRFGQLGRIQDLEDAISFHRKALILRPPGHPDRTISLNNLASGLRVRFEQLGKIEDLEDSISSQREAIALFPPGHSRLSYSLNNLGNALRNRFEQVGKTEDIEDAISCYRKALSLRPPGHPRRHNSLNNLADSLRIRFEVLGKMQDLEDAISSFRETLTLCPPGHPFHSSVLTNLAYTLYSRFEQYGRMEDLENAIASYYKALTFRPPGHPRRFLTLSLLAIALHTRFEKLGKIENLEDAISAHHEVLTLCPPGHPKNSMFLKNLASALDARFQRLGRVGDLEESISLYEQAANDLISSSLHRLDAAVCWAAVARRHHHKSILRAYSISLHLLRRCLILHPDVDSQQKFLATTHIPRSLASDAASAAIDAGELETAVEFLEEGRSMLWSKMEGYRHPLDQLRQTDKQLADRLETLSIELERFVLSSSRSGLLASEGPMTPAALEAQMRRHRILSGEWEEVVGRVRNIEGFSDFLQAVPFLTLRTAAVEGPIVLINISKYRSDAIILHANHPRPVLVTLPDANPHDLTQLAKQLILARDEGTINPSKLFLPILRDLWDDIIAPVHDRLTELGIPERGRVWWCPTSELCALPLHAAGPYKSEQKNLPDIYLSSYIPTISSLIRARSNMLSHDVTPKLLVIGQSETLPKVQDEINHIRQLGGFVDVMIGEEANHDRVLHGLQQHSWAHFACHGHLGDNSQPFHASFELHGGRRLTLLDLIQARLPNAELAFLSACHSAAGDLITPDETIHLAAALQFCGFRSVVGTLWAMEDQDGPTISREFYKHMFRKPGNEVDFRDSAEALNLAIRNMRKNGVPLHRWIMFVHIGA